MSVYDSNIAIMAYAVLSERFNSEESVILSFRPLVEDLLASIADNMVQKVDLVNLYKDRYGYAIPPAILNEILLSLYSCNNKNGNRRYFICSASTHSAGICDKGVV
ncbi:MAG: hypothetical protein IJB70_07530 [Clostridia bacterium]|nr:hypothetical protein [Clostridia bacterium]MBQ6863652.1 hypothetical protein [Clostridia bacterium]